MFGEQWQSGFFLCRKRENVYVLMYLETWFCMASNFLISTQHKFTIFNLHQFQFLYLKNKTKKQTDKIIFFIKKKKHGIWLKNSSFFSFFLKKKIIIGLHRKGDRLRVESIENKTQKTNWFFSWQLKKFNLKKKKKNYNSQCKTAPFCPFPDHKNCSPFSCLSTDKCPHFTNSL